MSTREFTRIQIPALAAGATYEVDIVGRYVAVEGATYTNGSAANLIQFDNALNTKLPLIANAEYSLRDYFSKLIITGGTDGGAITLLTHENPCVGHNSPDFRLHPLSNVAGLTPIFILDADWSYRSFPVGTDIPVLYDSSGNGNDFAYSAGSHARKIAGGAASGDAHTLNFPATDTAYFNSNDLFQTPNGTDIILMVSALNVGNIVADGSIFGQGSPSNAACYRLGHGTTGGIYINMHGSKVARDNTRSCINNFAAALWVNYYASFNQGCAVRFNGTAVDENQYPVGGGLTDIETGHGVYIGNDNQTSINGLGNSAFRLGFLGAWIYQNPNYTNEPLEYVADVYGVTLTD